MTQTDPGALLAAMRAKAPLVQCITNFVAMNIAANVLLAAGASPAMVHAAEESGAFARLADALTVNPGTPDPAWIEGMAVAAQAAVAAGRPWVLDPVAVGATAFRREACTRLLALKPALVRGNASEIRVLAGLAAAGRGADTGDSVASAEAAARALAARAGCIVAVTGPEDFVTDGERALRLHGGHALMPRVTALGCALTALCGAFLAVGDDPLAATAGALATFKAAGALAGAQATGPGSFVPAFLDALHALEPEAVSATAPVVSA